MTHWQINPYGVALIVSAFASIVVAVYGWRRRQAVGAVPLVVLGLGAAEWSLSYAVAVGMQDLSARIFWAKMQHLGIAVIPLAMLSLVLQYTGNDRWLTPLGLVLLALVPLTGVLLAWTNEAHGFIWAEIEWVVQGSASLLDLKYGLFFWIYAGYNYLVLFLSTLLLLRTFLLSSHLQRRQTATMLLGAAFPWLGNFLYLAGWNPFPSLDLTPFGYSLSGLVLAWGLLRYRLLDIVPVARDKVVEGMGDGVIVLDTQQRIVDINPAAQNLIRCPFAEIVGQPIERFLSGRPDLVERYRDVLEVQAQITLGEGETQRYYDLRISPLYSQRGTLTGRLVVFHDVTERRQAEEELRQAKERAEVANEEITALNQQLHRLFRRFATKEVADELLAQGFESSGRYVEATAMFVDMRSFTAIADSQSPAAVFELLNDYFTHMIDAVGSEGGIVNQIVGDGLMAIFGAPLPYPDHSQRAVRVALKMMDRIDLFNRGQAAKNRVQVRIGIGIASGRVIAGYLGTEVRATYTCVGDTVNTAARLEAYTKEVGQPILIDENTRLDLDDSIQVEEQGWVSLVGKEDPVRVFSVPVGQTSAHEHL